MGVQIPRGKGQFFGERVAHCKVGLETFCREQCTNSWTDSGVLKEAQVQSYSRGGATWEGTLAPPREYDWTVCLRRRCGLMSNYFDRLFYYSARSKASAEYWIHFVARSNGVHAFGYNSAESEPIWMKSRALWLHYLGLALANFGHYPRSSESWKARRFFC